MLFERLTAPPEATEAGVTVPTVGVPPVPEGTVIVTLLSDEDVPVVNA